MAIQTWNLTADGSGTAMTLKQDEAIDALMVHVVGTFGSGTVKFQGSMLDSGDTDWADVTNMTGITAATCKYVEVTGLKRIKPVLSGSTSPDLDISLGGVKVNPTVVNS